MQYCTIGEIGWLHIFYDNRNGDVPHILWHKSCQFCTILYYSNKGVPLFYDDWNGKGGAFTFLWWWPHKFLHSPMLVNIYFFFWIMKPPYDFFFFIIETETCCELLNWKKILLFVWMKIEWKIARQELQASG